MATVHDHQKVNAAQVDVTLSAWKAKYSLPQQVTSVLGALVAVESVDFQESHVVLQGQEGEIFEIAAGGRNYNGAVSLAFSYGLSKGSVIKYPPSRALTPTEVTSIAQVLQHSIFPKIMAEAILLENELRAGGSLNTSSTNRLGVIIA